MMQKESSSRRSPILHKTTSALAIMSIVFLGFLWSACSPSKLILVFHNYSGQDVTIFWDRPEEGYSWSVEVPMDRIVEVKLGNMEFAPTQAPPLDLRYPLYRSIRIKGSNGLDLTRTYPDDFSYIHRSPQTSLTEKGRTHIVVRKSDVVLMMWDSRPKEGAIVRNAYELDDAEVK